MAANALGQDTTGVGYGSGVAIRPNNEPDMAKLRIKACGQDKVDYDAETKIDQDPMPEAPADPSFRLG